MLKQITSLCVVLALLGCESEPGTDLQNSISQVDGSSAAAIFDPSNSIIPFPNDLLFQGTVDGTLNIPVADANDVSDPAVSMNALDGFSTVAPMSTTFGAAINEATISGNVRVFKAVIDNLVVNPSSPTFAVGAVTAELTYGVDFVAAVSAQTSLVLLPLKPLAEKSGYLVVITDGLKDTTGKAFKPDATYSLAKLTTSLLNGATSTTPALSDAEAQALEPLRLLTNAAINSVTTFDSTLDRDDIILSWSFSTQSIGDVLTNEHSQISGGSAPAIGAFSSFGASPNAQANIFQGSIDVPYYLDAASGTNDPAPLSSRWSGASGSFLTHLNINAVVKSTETIPLLVSLPTGAAMDAASIPVVIYQHGITTNRTTMLAVADTLASAGFAVVAIDLPLHGVTGIETDGTQVFKTGNERTFDLDLVTQDASGSITAATPDGVVDSSGRHFIQLTSLLTSRDHARQAVTDLFTLTKGLATMDVNGGGADFNASEIYFLGHSLGGIVGVPFLALEPGVKDAVIAMSGGGIPKILDGSAAFGPEISAGLAAAGVVKGTADYEAFFVAAQTVLDSADPVNYANGTMGDTDGNGAINARGLLMFEVVGGSGSPSDLVIPNTVPDGNDTTGTVAAPLSGTEPLALLMGLTQISVDTSGSNLQHIVKFSGGHHGSLLTPSNTTGISTVSASTETHDEMHRIIKAYFENLGGNIDITDTSVIAP